MQIVDSGYEHIRSI